MSSSHSRLIFFSAWGRLLSDRSSSAFVYASRLGSHKPRFRRVFSVLYFKREDGTYFSDCTQPRPRFDILEVQLGSLKRAKVSIEFYWHVVSSRTYFAVALCIHKPSRTGARSILGMLTRCRHALVHRQRTRRAVRPQNCVLLVELDSLGILGVRSAVAFRGVKLVALVFQRGSTRR